jgi:hypothetical protein
MKCDWLYKSEFSNQSGARKIDIAFEHKKNKNKQLVRCLQMERILDRSKDSEVIKKLDAGLDNV